MRLSAEERVWVRRYRWWLYAVWCVGLFGAAWAMDPTTRRDATWHVVDGLAPWVMMVPILTVAWRLRDTIRRVLRESPQRAASQ